MPIANSKVKGQKSKVQVKSGKIETKLVKKASGLSVPVYSLSGRSAGTLNLPKEMFGASVNQILLTQAMRVYSANIKNPSGSTKTRGEVRGSTAKVYRQKGTGRARHGAKTAPIFVGGGVAFGPRSRKVTLTLPKKMKQAALVSALSLRTSEGNVLGLSGLEKVSGKTKEMAKLTKELIKDKKSNILIMTGQKLDTATRAGKNLPGVDILEASQVNAYEIINHSLLAVTKEAVEKLSKNGAKV